MAYGLYKYITVKERTGKTGKETFTIELWKKDYTGSTEQLEGAGNYFQHDYTSINSSNPFNDTLQSSKLSMEFLVENASHISLLNDIFNADEDEYLLKKKIGITYYWQGKVLNDLLEYSEGDYPSIAKIVAVDLSYLKGVDYALTTGYETIITTIASVLNTLSFGSNIVTHTNWVENNQQAVVNDDFLNRVYHDKYGFREYKKSSDESDKEISQYEVLDRICKNYNLILRQSYNTWYIYQLSALNDPTSVKRYVYNSSGVQQTSFTVDLTADIDSNDLYLLSSSTNKSNPAVKKASIEFKHRTGTNSTIVNASRISGITDPSLPVAKYNIQFQPAGDELIEISARNYATLSRAYYNGNSNLPQAPYLLKAGQYYWNDDASLWQEYADITTSASFIQPSEVDTVNNKIRIVSNDFAHGDVIRVEAGLATGLSVDTEYYLIDVSGTVATGSNTFYYQLSETPDGTPVTLGTKDTVNRYIYRVNNRQQMNTTTPLAFNSTVWWYDFNVITTEIPSNADGSVEFYAMGAVMPPQDFVIVNSHYWEYASPTNFWVDASVILKDPTTSNGDSYLYELEQNSVKYSTKLEYPSVYFGDGPVDYARSALKVTTTTTADTSTYQWDFVGGSTNSNFFEIWLKEVINFQRTARRNIRAELFGNFRGYEVLSYDSKYFFFLGGTHNGNGNTWDADLIEINIETGTDTFTEYINSDNASGTGGSGGGTNASVEGISVDFADSRYLQISNDLSDVDDIATARTNLGLGTGDSPTFAGLTVDGLVVEDEIRDLQSNVIENHLEIESLQDNKVEKGQLFPDGDEQALGTGDAVTFSTVNTGQGANELYAMDQDVQQADSPTFNRVVLSNQADDGTKALRADREVNAGDGLTGGGALTSDQTLTLGTPSTTTVGGSNAVTTDSHTHALDLSGRSITLSNDSDSVITFDANTQNLGADRTYTPTIADHASGQRGVLSIGAQTIYGAKTFNDATTFDTSALLDDTAKIESEAGYVSGFTGSGFNLSKDTTWKLELDDMYIRGALFASEFIVNQISAVNGSDILSPGRGKVEEISTNFYTVSDPQGGNFASFAVNDIVIVQQVRPHNSAVVKRIVRQVTDVTNNVIELATLSGAPSDVGSIEVGDIIVAIGSTSDTDRQANIFRTVTETDSPYVRVNDGIASWADWTGVDKLKLQYGLLDGLSSISANISGYGLYAENTFLTGSLLVGDLSKSANYLEYDSTDGLTIKVGDDDLSTAIAEIRSDLIDIYLGNESSFSNIQFLSGQLVLKAGTGNSIASITLDGTQEDVSAISLDADYILITGTTIFKSAKDGSTTPDTLGGATFIDGGTIVTDSITATEIDVDNLFAQEIEVTGKLLATDGTYETAVGKLTGVDVKIGAFTSNGDFYGLYRDLNNYFGTHDGDVFAEYAFRVGDGTNYIEFDGTDITIKTDTFDLDSANLAINSSNSSVTIGSSGFLEDGSQNYRLNADGLKINTYGLNSKANISIVGSIAFGKYGVDYSLNSYGSYIGSYNDGGTISKSDSTLYLKGERGVHIDGGVSGASASIVIIDNLPTSATGLPSGAIYNSSGTLKIV